MEYNFNEASGMSNAPLFIGYTPFKLDFSPVKETADLRASIRMQKQKDLDALKKGVSDLPMPEFKGLSADEAQPYRVALEARNAMMSSLTESSNPHWAAKHDPKFLAAQQQYAQITSPDIRTRMQEEKAGLDSYVKRAADENAQGNLLFDSNGFAKEDPEYKGQPIAGGEYANRRQKDENYSLWTGNVADLANAVIATPEKFRDEISKAMSQTGILQNRNNIAGNQQAWANLMNTYNDPMAQATASMIVNKGWKSNSAQLQHAVEKLRLTMTPQQKASLQQAYFDSGAYIKTGKDGKPLPGYAEDPMRDLKDKSGNFSPGKLYEMAMNDRAFETEYSKEKVTLHEKMLAEQMGQFLIQEDFADASMLKATKPADGSGGGSTNNNLNYYALARNGVLLERDANGNPRPLSAPLKMQVPLAVVNPNGENYTVRRTTDAYKVPIDAGVFKKTLENLGLVTAQGIPLYDPKGDSGIKVSDKFAGMDVVGQGGRRFTEEELKRMNITGIQNSMLYAHRSLGTASDTNPEIARSFGVQYDEDGSPVLRDDQKGMSSLTPFLIIEAKFDDDAAGSAVPMDYANVPYEEGGRPSEIRAFNVYDDKLTEGSGLVNRKTGWGWDPGEKDTKVQLYIRIPVEYEAWQGTRIDAGSLRTDPNAIQQEQQSNATPNSVIDQVSRWYPMAPTP